MPWLHLSLPEPHPVGAPPVQWHPFCPQHMKQLISPSPAAAPNQENMGEGSVGTPGAHVSCAASSPGFLLAARSLTAVAAPCHQKK